MTDTGVPIMDWLNEANTVLNVHWLAPDEPWEPRCKRCVDGHCPAQRRAEARIAVLWRLGDRQ